MNLLKIDQLAPMNHIYRFFELNDYLRSVSENGYVSIDYWTCGAHYLVDYISYQNTRSIKKKLKKYGLNIICVTPEQNCPKPYNFASKDTELKKRTRSYYQNVIMAASEFGCSKMLVTSGWQFLSEPREEAWKRSVEMIGSLCQFAERYGVYLTIETLSPFSTTLVNKKEDVKRMMDEVDSKYLTVTIDLDTIIAAGETVQEYFDLFGSKVNHCHFMDHKDSISGHMAWGDGDRNPEKFLTIFKNNNYKGHFTLEYTLNSYFKNPHSVYAKTMEIFKPYIERG